MDKKLIKKYIVFTIGTLIFGFGISFSNKSLFGGNSMAILVSGVFNHLSLSYGTCNLLVGIIEVIVGYLCDKRNVTFATFFGLFCGSYSIDFANLFIKDTNLLSIRIIYMIAGILLYCLGLAIQQIGKCGYSNLDCFVFGLGKALKIDKYHTIRWIVDIVFIALGLLLGAIAGIGTILLFIVSGILIEFFVKKLKKVIKFD